ncbi:unnamed protein product, partial [Heterotrigona itama]
GSVEINTRDGETQRNNPTPPTLRECQPPRSRWKRYWPITTQLITITQTATADNYFEKCAFPWLSLNSTTGATLEPRRNRKTRWMEEQLLTDTLLRELINQMGNELADTVDSYLEYQDKPKEIPIELPADYDGMDTLNPNPSIRDQEYLQHSTLWSHQRINSNDKTNDRQKIKPGSIKNIKDEKENALPAYCTPPNPCPVGYTSENNCIVNFENTAAFSRDYQSAQDCMCDTEHMLDCSVDSTNSNLPSMHISNSNFNQIVDQFQA